MKRKIKEIYIHIVIEENRCFNASFNYPNDYPQAYYGMQYLSRCLTKHQSQTKDFVLCWWCVIRKLVKWWKAFEKWKILIHKNTYCICYFSKSKKMILSFKVFIVLRVWYLALINTNKKNWCWAFRHIQFSVLYTAKEKP